MFLPHISIPFKFEQKMKNKQDLVVSVQNTFSGHILYCNNKKLSENCYVSEK